MSEHALAAGDDTLKFGLLMESAQAHQKMAETHLEQLRVHTRDLDAVVREEIRRTLIDELQAVTTETHRAAGALRAMKRAAYLRGACWNIGMAVLCTAIPAAIAHWTLPSAADIAVLRTQHDSLERSVERLQQRGAKVDWRRCGAAERLCVRVDRKAPVYGDDADYYVARGY